MGQTIFTASGAGTTQLTFDFETAASDAKGFTLNVTGTPSNATGLQVITGEISDFAVSQQGGNASNFHAVALDSGATATRGSIAITSGSGVGLHLAGAAGADDGVGNASELTMTGTGQASIGIAVNTNIPGGRIFDRLRIISFGRGVEVTTGGFLLTNSLIDMGATNAAEGIDAFNGLSTSNISANASRVTIVGTGPFQSALSIGAGATGTEAFEGGFSDLVLFAAGTSSTGLRCTAGGISVSATINSYAIRGAESNFSGCSPTTFNKLDLATIDPGFRDSAAGDYRLKPSSPLVDSGMVGEAIGSGERDLSGATRVVDGDGNGSVTVDLGAFEYQRSAPTVAASASSLPSRPGQPISFIATGSDTDGEILTFAWSFDDGASATGASTTHPFSTEGTHTATVTATDEAGDKASATVTVTVSVDPLPSARVIAKPARTFVRTKKGFTAPKRKQPFFTVAFADTAKAKFTLKVRRKGKLRTVRGVQTISVKTGANKFAFGGKFGGKILKAGRYRVTITPLGADAFAGEAVAVDFRLK
ncbi:MAG: PKD domain-containing protein [Actinobacteria bacterium]|nr:PKD domain-containing protein [Actinomycetota bacterium]